MVQVTSADRGLETRAIQKNGDQTLPGMIATVTVGTRVSAVTPIHHGMIGTVNVDAAVKPRAPPKLVSVLHDMLSTCRLHVDYMSITCQLHVDYLLITCSSLVDNR